MIAVYTKLPAMLFSNNRTPSNTACVWCEALKVKNKKVVLAGNTGKNTIFRITAAKVIGAMSLWDAKCRAFAGMSCDTNIFIHLKASFEDWRAEQRMADNDGAQVPELTTADSAWSSVL